MQLITKRYKKNFFNIVLSSSVLFGFCYTIINSEKFFVEEKPSGVNAAFLELKKPDDNGYISLDNFVTFDEQGDKFTYIVQPGDNLASIAEKFGTTISNIRKINNLGKTKLKAGMKLTISQQEGILYDMTESISVKDFAAKYKLDIQDLMELNYISDANYVFEKEEEIFIPVSESEAKKLGLIKAIEQPVPSQPSKPSKPNPGNNNPKPSKPYIPEYDYDGKSVIARWYYKPNISNTFARGHCTRYVAIKKFPYKSATTQARIFGGNAKNWYANAKAAGYAVGKTAKKGSVVVFRHGGRYYYGYGHVAIVLEIDKDSGKILVEEMNAVGRFFVSRRWVSMNDSIIGYIYM